MQFLIQIAQANYIRNCEKSDIPTVRKSTMSKSSIAILIITSAVIGAVIGVMLAVNVLGGAIKSEIDNRLADYTGAVQPVAADSDPDISGGPDAQPSSSGSIQGSFLLDPEELAVTSVYKRLSSSVVHVSTVQYYRNFFFQVVPQEGMGSGFIISEDGYILTNNHVVEGAQSIIVRLSNGEEYTADLVGTDQMTDLAVLHIPDLEIPSEWVAPLGDSESIQVGQRAIAIGNPFGLDSTVTVGVISALDRPVSTEETSFENMIQTDASINPGNSGGPLIDSSGKVIGINTVILSRSGGSHGIGFAIPVNAAKKVLDDLIQFGRVRRPSLGFNGITVYSNLAEALDLSVNYGVLVQDVQTGSGASEAGLRSGINLVYLRDRFRQYSFYGDGDIIIEFEGEKVTELSRLAERIHRLEIGTEVTLVVLRDGEQIELSMVLTE